MSTSIPFKGEKLIGRSNYIEWLTNATLFLEANGFMPYISGLELEPDKSLYYKDSEIPYSPELAIKYIDKLGEFRRNNIRALGAIKMIISVDNTERFKDKQTAKELFEAIQATFGESSLELIGRYLDRIISASYSSFKTMDEYTSQIQAAAIYLKELNYEVPKPFLVWLIFKGLPSPFDSFNSRKYEEITRELDNIDISKLISDLISEESRMKANLEVNKVTSRNKSYCTHYNKTGHIESKCYSKYPELRPKTTRPFTSPKGKNPKENSKDNTKSKSNKVIMTTINSSYNLSDNREANKATYTTSYLYNNLVLDSGATEHYTPNKEWLLDYKTISNKSIFIANGDELSIRGIGNIPIYIDNKEILIKDVNYIPELKSTLISSKELTKKGWSILFEDSKAIITHNIAKYRVIANWISNAYYINTYINYSILEPIVYKTTTSLEGSNSPSTLDLYHKRLLHINKDYILKTIQNTIGLKPIKTTRDLQNCDPCYYSKITRSISREPLLDNNKALSILDIDIAGPFRQLGLQGERFFISITCRASRAIWIYPIKFKSEAIDILAKFYTLIETQFEAKIQVLRLDNAAEFKSTKWTEFCSSKGIICEYTSPYTPSQNGIAERLNRYILERLIAICSEKGIPLKLWPYLVQAIAHIKNRTYSSIIGKTPYEALTKTKPKIDYIKILGSLTYVLDSTRTSTDLGKLAYKANKGILVGFKSSKNFLIYLPTIDKVVDSSNIAIKEDLIYKDSYITKEDYNSLLEQETPSLEVPSLEAPSLEEQLPSLESSPNIDNLNKPQATYPVVEIPSYRPSSSSLDTQIETTRKSGRLQEEKPENQGLSIYNLASIAYISSLNKGENNKLLPKSVDIQEFGIDIPYLPKIEYDYIALANSTTIEGDSSSSSIFKEPKSYKEAMNSSYREHWLKAMNIELNILKENNTWELIPLPEGVRPLKTKWVYKIKNPKNSSNISDIIFKARFVAKGYEQLYGLEYIETYAAVIKQMAWKLLFALAILNSWLIYKIDMISAFTQGIIDSYIYLIQPEGFIDPNNPDYVLRLNKALYGLKQSARIWYYTIKDKLLKIGFIVLNSDNCIFINKNIGVIICLYIDDLAIIAPNSSTINRFISSIKEYFTIKDLGPIKDYLGIDIDLNSDKGYIKLSQANYIKKVLAKYSMENCNPISTPLDSKIKLEPNKEQASRDEIKWFQGIIGSLLYITLGTRPDLAYSVIKLARYASNPSNNHIILVKRILRYLKATIDYNIIYNKSSTRYISGYCDSDYAGDIATAKSTLGWIFLIAGSPISWKSKLQTIIAQSTTEAEYIAINSVSKEAVYIKNLMTELDVYNQAKFPIYTDNQGALALAQNPVFHERTKHIAVKYHYIRSLLEEGVIDLVYINTKDQKADGLTKALDKIKFRRFLTQIGLLDLKEESI